MYGFQKLPILQFPSTLGFVAQLVCSPIEVTYNLENGSTFGTSESELWPTSKLSFLTQTLPQFCHLWSEHGYPHLHAMGRFYSWVNNSCAPKQFMWQLDKKAFGWERVSVRVYVYICLFVRVYVWGREKERESESSFLWNTQTWQNVADWGQRGDVN